MSKKIRNQLGQSLIEIVVAVGIIAVVLVGTSDLISRSLSLASFQSSKNEATNIAQNQLNYYRQQRDLHPTDFFDHPENYSLCVGSFDTSKYTCSIAYDTVGVDSGANMTVTIVWHDGDKEISTKLSQLLAKPTK